MALFTITRAAYHETRGAVVAVRNGVGPETARQILDR
jgi:hypothetical protein